MNYYAAVIAASFGHGSSKPLRSAICKLMALGLGALSLSILLSRSVPHLAHGMAGQSIHWSITVVFAVQIVTLFSLLPAMGISNGTNDKLASLLLVLPFWTIQRKILLMLPNLLLMAIGLLLSGPILGAMILPAGMWPGLFGLALLLGSISALGIAYGFGRRKSVQGIGSASVLYLEYKLTAAVHTPPNTLYWPIVFLALIVVLCSMAVYSSSHLEKQIRAMPKVHEIRSPRLQVGWFNKKFLRSPITLLSLGVTFGISLVVLLAASHQQLLDTQLLATLAAVLAAGLASDVRSISRRIWPPEITVVRGVHRFVLRELMTIIFACLVAVSPLLWIGIIQEPWHFIAQALVGIAVGFVASTLLVPAKRDITSQTAAGLLCIALTLAPAKLQLTNNVLSMMLLVGALLVCAFALEYKRNPFIWRIHAR